MADLCASCGYNTKKTQYAYRNRRYINTNAFEWHREYLVKLHKTINPRGVLCRTCINRLDRLRKSANDDRAEGFKLPLLPRTHRYCIICKDSTNSVSTIQIPSSIRIELLNTFGVLAYEESRVCIKHIDNNALAPDVSMNASLSQSFAEPTSDLVLSLFIRYSNNQNPEVPVKTFLDFSRNSAFTDATFAAWTGWTKEQFMSMHDALEVRQSSQRCTYTSLAIFWIRLKTALSYSQIATLFDISTDVDGLMSISRTIHSVADSLNKHFVPYHLGVGHLDRSDATKHMTSFSNVLFDNKTVTIWDGTYYYIQNSGDYEFARRTYSGHKHRPLLKFMSIVLPNGYVLDTLGPYLSDGKNNDAGITKHIFNSNQSLCDWLRPGDVCVVDRGFRDCLQDFADLDLDVKMPCFLAKGEKQHSTEEANSSRVVTKVRWVVEAYHGGMKKWKFFDDVINNKFIPILGQFNRILSAALNAFRPPLLSNPDKNEELARQMHEKMQNIQSSLKERVEKGSLSSRGRWVSMDDHAAAPDFPVISEEYLSSLTLGTYELKQARCYTLEHLSENGDYKIEIHPEAEDLLRVRIQSRHSGFKRYFLWIQLSPDDETDPVQSWYCQCKAGARTLGCCAHVASVIWYLGFARHEELKPRKSLLPVVLNAAVIQ